MTRSAVRKKRKGPPRRGRVVDKDYLAWIAQQLCIAYWPPFTCHGRITVHHVRRFGEQKHDRRTIPLCEAHHLHDYGPYSIERLGKEEFEAQHGIDIEAAIQEYNRQYESMSSMR
jgi:uncharacterized CHY-type Zn-finger protein